VDIKAKILRALTSSFPVDYARLDDEDGISGFVVSSRFQDMSALDRQGLIDEALRSTSARISPEEQRQVLMIAALTPAEYDTAGARIRVDKIKELAGGAIKVVLHGGYSDAEYVRGVLKNQQGVKTTEPKQVPGAIGDLMSFQAKAPVTSPLTKASAIRILSGDQYIQVMPNA
jgi:hypothetical protein